MHTGNNMKQQKMILKNLFSQFLISIQKMMLTSKNSQQKNACFALIVMFVFQKINLLIKQILAPVWIRGERNQDWPGYYFHLEPGKSFLGGGTWQPDPDKLKKVRQEIDYCFDEFKKIISSKKFKTLYGDLYTGEGIQLSKVPQGFEKDNPASEYLKFKSWLVIADIKDADLTSKDLVSKTVAAFGIMQPFVKFLNRPLE